MTTPLINALIRDADGVRLAEPRRPERRPGWVRIDVLLAGVCRTDLYAADGLFPQTGPRILGHELVGEVTECDDGSALSRTPGRRVTVSPLIPCGTCAGCATGTRCLTPRMLGVGVDGAFADELVVPESCVHAVPADLSRKRAAYVEPIAASLAVLKAPIRPTERGAILGTGRIAELTQRILAARGFSGVPVLDPARVEAGRFDYVIETSATPAVLSAALRAVRPGGVVVLKSRPPASVAIDVTQAVLSDITLFGAGYGSFPEAIALAGELPIDDLLGDVFDLEDFAAAFARARDPRGSAKIFLAPRGRGRR